MAVYKLTDKPRKRPWCADWYEGGIRRKRMFATKEEAVYCEASELTSIAQTGRPLRRKEREKKFVKEIVEHYRDEVSPQHEGHSEDTYRIKVFLKHDICKKSLALVNKRDAKAYIAHRLAKGKKPSTVRREVNLWVQVFETAREEDEGLQNPFTKITIRGSSDRRERRLIGDELQRLEHHCEGCRGNNKYFVKLAIRLAIETGMRQEELFNLRWEHVSVERREIKIVKSKMDYKRALKGRTIVLTIGAELLLLRLAKVLMDANSFDLSERVFPMTQGAFSQAWLAVVKRAKIKDLHFHDLRHEAASRFDEADLSGAQRDHMTGHGPSSQGGAYVHAALKAIREKLDKHLRGGEKVDEELERAAMMERKGLTVEAAANLMDEAIADENAAKAAKAKRKHLIEEMAVALNNILPFKTKS
jgi:integrase